MTVQRIVGIYLQTQRRAAQIFRPSDLTAPNRDRVEILLKNQVRELRQLADRFQEGPEKQKHQTAFEGVIALQSAFRHNVPFVDLPTEKLSTATRSILGRAEYFTATDPNKSKDTFYWKRTYPADAHPQSLEEDMAMKQFVDAVYTNAPR